MATFIKRQSISGISDKGRQLLQWRRADLGHHSGQDNGHQPPATTCAGQPGSAIKRQFNTESELQLESEWEWEWIADICACLERGASQVQTLATCQRAAANSPQWPSRLSAPRNWLNSFIMTRLARQAASKPASNGNSTGDQAQSRTRASHNKF